MTIQTPQLADERVVTRRSRREPLVLAAACALLVGCLVVGFWLVLAPGDRTTTGPVTEREARDHLDRMVRAGLAADFETLCAYNGSPFNCEMALNAGGAAGTVPDQPPTSVSATYAEVGGGNETPGWVLTVQGRDGRGLAYRTEVMVFRDDEDNLKAINAVWWSGAQLLLGPVGTTSP